MTNTYSLVIAGHLDKKSKSYLTMLRKLIGKREDIHVVVDPSDSELCEYYRNCTAAVVCSLNEDWGLTTLEANSHGKPVLAVNSGGPRESVIQGKTGFLLPPTVGVFAKFFALLVQNPVLNSYLGSNAYHHVKKYDINHFKHLLDEELTLLK